MSKPNLIGVVNVTSDSFSDGGCHLSTASALERAQRLLADGADVIELGAASSHPDAAEVRAREEIDRLAPILDALIPKRVSLCVDSWKLETQRFCLRRGVQMLNDIQGFPAKDLYSELGQAGATLVVMHSIQRQGRATRLERTAASVVAGVYEFFQTRIDALVAGGVARDQLVLDPGMGFFLGSTPEPSLAVLAEIEKLKRTFALPVLISVSRKSFLGRLTGREVQSRGAATLAAEIFAAQRGADFIRTHDVGAIRDALKVLSALSDAEAAKT